MYTLLNIDIYFYGKFPRIRIPEKGKSFLILVDSIPKVLHISTAMCSSAIFYMSYAPKEV
jgi:hypothetical protein